VNARLPVLPSASSLDRAAACPASILLPRWGDITSAWAERGTALHAFLEAYSAAKVAGAADAYSVAMEAVPEEFRDECSALDLDRLPLGDGYAVEESWALDLITGAARRIPAPDPETHIYQGVEPWEVPLTLDVRGTREPLVVDFKSGFIHRDHTHQLMAGAAVEAHALQADAVTLELIRLDSGARDQRVVDAFDLVMWRAEWVRRFSDARETTQVTDDQVRPGAHCRNCKAWLACPAKMGVVVDAASGELVRRLNRVATGGDVKRTLELLDEVAADLKRMRDTLFGAAREQPIDLGDGTVLGVRPTEREQVRADVAWPVLVQMLGPELAERAATRDISKASIQRAVRVAKEKDPARWAQPATHIQASILEAIQARGGIDRKVSSTVSVHRRNA